MKWSKKHLDKGLPVVFAMEATGVYYESLAYHLFRINKSVSVILPNKVKHFAKSHNVKTKTDEIDARIIAQMGVERSLPLWNPPKPIFKKLRELTRLLSDFKKERTAFFNKLEAIQASEDPGIIVIKSNKRIIAELEKGIIKLGNEIQKLISSDAELLKKVEKLSTIKGIGFTTIAIIIAETQGFAMIKSRKQLASFAGYDVVQNESGTSVKGKTRISKKGNSRIRAAMHFPALVSSRFNKSMKEDYLRIISNKSNKMIGVTALQRKLLLLMYTLWKNDSVFDENHRNFR